MTRDTPETPDSAYREQDREKVRCPACGAESGITTTEAVADHAQPAPPDDATSCECGHRGHALAFHHEWKAHRMSEAEERELFRRWRRAEAKMTAWQESAHYHSLQREP